MGTPGPPSEDAHWYKDAVFYELHVRAFQDSDADGMGDFRGLTDRLDYVQELGVTVLWLLPFYPSPWRDDGYDISDYSSIHPSYGTLADFRVFLREAHRRGLRVVTELVLNHTSDQHPWFQRARRAPEGSPHRRYYVWSETADRYRDARVIFRDFEPSNWTWDPIARSYYWHRFFSHQPDLNFENPAVQRALLRAMDGWFRLGVDGMRLDAVPYLYEREGTSCENLPETHAFLKGIRKHVDRRHPYRMLLAEANQWPEDAVQYFGQGDECHMAFHFPIMPRMFMALHMEDRFPILDILAQTPAIPESAQWALFLRNHDELTLEMVTDEERDYMYRVYGNDPRSRINLGIRRRLAPLLGNHRRKIELMNGLLFSLPGTPVIYYGDEIGMGDNIYLGDRNGVRTPMQWSADRNAGFSRANPQRLYLPITIDPEYHYEAVNVDIQNRNNHSLLWWMRRLIATRKRFRAFGRGTIEFLTPENRKILAFLRLYEEERILVVANLSRFVQFVELDLSAFRGRVPVEIFGRTEFPKIGDGPYLLTLGPHTFYWFSLEVPKAVDVAPPEVSLPVVHAKGTWEACIDSSHRTGVDEALGPYMRGQRWFFEHSGRLRGVRVLDAPAVPLDGFRVRLLLVQVESVEGGIECFALPVTFASAAVLGDGSPSIAVVRVHTAQGTEEGRLVDLSSDPRLYGELMNAFSRRREYPGRKGVLRSRPGARFRGLRGDLDRFAGPICTRTEQGNVVAVSADRMVLKFFRRVQEGPNPDVELGRFLTERVGFDHVPPFAGALEYVREGGATSTIAILQGFVPNEGSAWSYTLDAVERYLEELGSSPPSPPPPGPPLRMASAGGTDALARERIGPYLESARLMGLRTAQFHVALASVPNDPSFAPEPYAPFDQRSLYQSFRNLTVRVLHLLRRRLGGLDGRERKDAERIVGLEVRILGIFQQAAARRVRAMRIHCHGDLHLGQVLYTGNDFHIIDLEGDPTRPLSERRIKRSPLRDVAGMLRSFDVASLRVLRTQEARGVLGGDRLPGAEAWIRFWRDWVSRTFLDAWLEVVLPSGLVPREAPDFDLLLDMFLLEASLARLGTSLQQALEGTGTALEVLRRLVDDGA